MCCRCWAGLGWAGQVRRKAGRRAGRQVLWCRRSCALLRRAPTRGHGPPRLPCSKLAAEGRGAPDVAEAQVHCVCVWGGGGGGRGAGYSAALACCCAGAAGGGLRRVLSAALCRRERACAPVWRCTRCVPTPPAAASQPMPAAPTRPAVLCRRRGEPSPPAAATTTWAAPPFWKASRGTQTCCCRTSSS